MTNRNFLSDDPLARFEHRVRSVGVWCDTSVSDKLRHKFIAKNPYSFLAISLCGTKVVSIDKLHENVLSQKCLVCELFDIRRGEGKKTLEFQLTSAINSIEHSKMESET